MVLNRGVSRRIVLVSGPPASGKTTIARPLAQALGFALLTKDDIKESLFTSLNGPAGDIEFSRRMSAAAMDLLWALAPHCPQVVLEANFRTRDVHERKRLRDLIAAPNVQLVEVCCILPLLEAARRFAERARLEPRHPAHALKEMSLEQLAVCEGPFALGPVIAVDTRRPVAIPALVQQVSEAFSDEQAS
jgi:predicted kinase